MISSFGRDQADPWDQYKFACQTNWQVENHRWHLLYNYLVATSVLILAWSGVFVLTPDGESDLATLRAVVVAILPAAGLALSVGWALVEYRAGCYVALTIDALKDAQKRISGVPPTLHFHSAAEKVWEKNDKLGWGVGWAIRSARSERFTVAVPALFAVVFFVLFVAGSPWIYTLGRGTPNVIEWLNGNQGAVQAMTSVSTLIVTVILVLITRSYAQSTRAQVDESTKMREAALKPYIHLVDIRLVGETPQPISRFGIRLEVVFLNIGAGPALSTRIFVVHPQLTFEPSPNAYSLGPENRMHNLALELIRGIGDGEELNPRGTLVAKYRDLYGKWWQTTSPLEFTLEQDDHGRPRCKGVTLVHQMSRLDEIDPPKEVIVGTYTIPLDKHIDWGPYA